MGIKIIKERERKERTDYERHFTDLKRPGCGFGFPCTPDGALISTNPASLENYRKCTDGTYTVRDDGITHWTVRWTEPAIAKCDCGHKISLESFTNTCEKCGRDYNSFGQQLAPREQWGEETGESAGDILSIGHTIS